MKQQTIRWYITTHPQATDESAKDYVDRILKEVKKDGVTDKRESVRRIYLKYKAKWIQTHESIDKNGEVISQKFKVERNEHWNKEGLEIERVTTNPNGKDWIKYKKSSYVPPKIDSKAIKEAMSKINLVQFIAKKPQVETSLLRLIYTDTHIGMEVNEDNLALYGGIWNEKELSSRKEKMIERLLSIFKGEQEIHIIDLGDLMDGWDATTTRKGHKLPQNMNNVKAFNTAVKFKVELANNIQQITGAKVTCYNIINDNHGGDFSAVVNDAVKEVLQHLNKSVTYINISKFIDHYSWNKHTFILCHGKDSKDMKFGFKPKIDEVVKGKIEDYIKFHKLYDQFVTFEKGDSHQQLFDYDSSDQFNYFNYRALSPNSAWIQVNFKKGSSGFVIQQVNLNEEEIKITPIKF